MNLFIFWGIFLVLTALVYISDKKYFMLRDTSASQPRPYSFARVQLAWWTVIVITSATAILVSRGVMPTFNPSTLYLLGISSATTIGATLIDISDQNNPGITVLAQDLKGQSFFLDILSDKNGINIHRFQTVVFNVIFGVWFIVSVVNNIGDSKTGVDAIIPIITPNNLVLLGVSSGVYAALKSTENKQPLANPDVIQTEVVTDEAKPQG